MKSELLINGLFSTFSLMGLYLINGRKYINIEAFLLLGFSNFMGRSIIQKENNAGGTTPYNPLKIPAKKITPIH